MSDFKPRTTIEANLETKALDNGSMYVTTDTKRMYVDTEDSRILIDGNIYLETEAKRRMILAPLSNKLYIVKETKKIYLYTTEWLELGSGSSSSSGGSSGAVQEENPWTLTSIVLSTNITLPALSKGIYTSVFIDISQYLPDTENYYEIICSFRAYANSSSANLAIYGEYDFVTPALPEKTSVLTLPVQITSSTGTGFCGGIFHWFTGPRRLIQLCTSYYSDATIRNIFLHGYKKIPKPTIVYNT